MARNALRTGIQTKITRGRRAVCEGEYCGSCQYRFGFVFGLYDRGRRLFGGAVCQGEGKGRETQIVERVQEGQGGVDLFRGAAALFAGARV